MSKKFLMGSNYFFNCYPEFKGHDNDYLILEDAPKDYKIKRQLRLSGNDYFYWKRMTPSEFIDYHLRDGLGMSIMKFLSKEFSEEIGFSINHLRQLEPLLNNLKPKHHYLKVIYDALINNNSFELTDEQRMIAYEDYKLNHNVN